MDSKAIAKQVVNLLFPLLQLDSIKQIGSEFKSATNQSVKDIWEKVRYIFIEEIEAEENDAEAQVAIRSNLRKQVEQDKGLKQELERLLTASDLIERLSKNKKGSTTNIVNQTHSGSGDNIGGNKIQNK